MVGGTILRIHCFGTSKNPKWVALFWRHCFGGIFQNPGWVAQLWESLLGNFIFQNPGWVAQLWESALWTIVFFATFFLHCLLVRVAQGVAFLIVLPVFVFRWFLLYC